jgi:hypothetical protein
MSDVNKLMSDAQQQLDEHKVWLKQQMHAWMNTQDGGEWKLDFRKTIMLVDDVKLRMSRVDEVVSILWEYPDELTAFLRSVTAPEHLRKSLEDGHVVDMNQPGFSARRAP